MAVASPLVPTPPRRFSLVWIFPVLLLCAAYGLLGLTFVQHGASHGDLMSRCVLMNPNLSRIWSVGHVEISLSYFGVFGAMVFYFLRLYGRDTAHLTDLGLAMAYILCSFLLDLFCVTNFQPFIALLIGDAIVITFTVLVSRQLWFQRLLGVFVPLVFFTCGVGHFLEGISYWKLTYPVNVPWTMVTADIGFAILVNAVRFPAFIRGQDVLAELAQTRQESQAKQLFFRDVMASVTDGHLRLCLEPSDLPTPLTLVNENIPLDRETLASFRHLAAKAARERQFSAQRVDDLNTAVGEASMNAVVHGGGGEAEVRADDESVQVWVKDHGTGIQMTELPRVTLELGYSTKDSLGHGFWLMLRAADTIHLLTGADGTTLVITLARQPTALPGFAL